MSWKKIALIGILSTVINLQVSAVEAGLISEKDEIKMGQQAASQLEEEVGVVTDSALNEEITRVGRSMVPYSERPKLTYGFKILDDSSVNALAIPGGFVYVYKGLLDYMPDENVRAAVIGHEIGHVAKKHSVNSIEKQLGIQIALGILVGDRYGTIQGLFTKTLFASYSRGDERQSDVKGFEYSTAAGYNPYSMLMALNRLGALPNQGKAGLFSDHPNADARVATLKKEMAKQGIRPSVAEKDSKANLEDGKWKWPVMGAANGLGYNAPYRAYAFAGRLSMLDRAGTFNGSNVRLVGNSLYHGQTYLIEFFPGDAEAAGMAFDKYLTEMLGATKNWPREAVKTKK